MALQICPHCKHPTLSWWQKYRAAKWFYVYCPRCGGKSCSRPFILVAYTMLYVWDVMLFGYLAYLDKNLGYLITLIVIWIVLDLFSLYLPLGAMRSTAVNNTNANSE